MYCGAGQVYCTRYDFALVEGHQIHIESPSHQNQNGHRKEQTLVRMWRQRNPYCWWAYTGKTTMEVRMEVPQKTLETELPHDSLQTQYPRDATSYFRKKNLLNHAHSCMFTAAKWDQPWWPSTDECMWKCLHIHSVFPSPVEKCAVRKSPGEWMELGKKYTEAQKDKHCMFSLTCGV